MAKKWSKGYIEYRRKYYAEKRRGNIKKHQIVMTFDEYKEAKSEGYTTKKMLQTQQIFRTKAEEHKAWKQYKAIRKYYARGETFSQDVKHFSKVGDLEDVELELKYHYNLSGLLHDRYALHFMIAFRIDSGEDQFSVLADYGY